MPCPRLRARSSKRLPTLLNLLASRFPCDLHGHIMKHAIDFCGDKNEINSDGVSAGLECAKSLPCTLATQILKSWINSWATSHRFHERIRLPCLLGCGGADSLHHYLKCQRLWDLVAVVLHDPPSFASIADRLGFRVSTPPQRRTQTLRTLAAIYHAYHFIRSKRCSAHAFNHLQTNHDRVLDFGLISAEFESFLRIALADSRVRMRPRTVDASVQLAPSCAVLVPPGESPAIFP